jgi:hypothetical protein
MRTVWEVVRRLTESTAVMDELPTRNRNQECQMRTVCEVVHRLQWDCGTIERQLEWLCITHRNILVLMTTAMMS